MDLLEFRQRYPQYDDLNDEALLTSLHKKYYSDMDYSAFRTRALGRSIDAGRQKSIEKFGPPGTPTPQRVVEPATIVAPETTLAPETGAGVPKMGTDPNDPRLVGLKPGERQALLNTNAPEWNPDLTKERGYWGNLGDTLRARTESKVVGGKLAVNEEISRVNRLNAARASVLPAAVAEAKRRGINILDVPAVKEAAAALKMRPDMFIRGVEDYAFETPENLQKIIEESTRAADEADAAAAPLLERGKKLGQIQQKRRPKFDSRWDPRSIAFDAMSSLPDLAAAAAVSVTTGNPVAGIASIFATTAPDYYAQARAEGKDPSTAQTYSLLMALGEAVPESRVLSRLTTAEVRKLIGDSAFKTGAKEAGATALAESASEMVTEVYQQGLEIGLYDKKTTLKEVLQDIAYAGAVGGVMGAPLGAVAGASAKAETPEGPAAEPDDLADRANEAYIKTFADTMAELSGQKMPQSARKEEAARRAIEAALEVVAERSPVDAARLRLNKLEQDAAAGKTVDPARLQEAREAVEQATVESVRGKLREGKLTPEQQQEAAQALRDMDSTPEEGAGEVRGVVRPEKPAKGQPPAEPAPKGVPTAKPDAPLSEVETARQDALNRIANADTIEEEALNDLIAEGLAKINPQTQLPVLLPPGKRQRSALNKRAEAAELAEKEAAKPEPVAKKPQPKSPKKTQVVAKPQQPVAEAKPPKTPPDEPPGPPPAGAAILKKAPSKPADAVATPQAKIERPTLNMADMEGTAPAEAKAAGKVSIGGEQVEFFDSKTGVYAKIGGKEVGFVSKLSDTETEIAVAAEHQKKGIGTELTRRFRKRFPKHPPGGFTAAGARTWAKAERQREEDYVDDRDGPEGDFVPAQPIEAEAMEEPGPGPAFAVREGPLRIEGMDGKQINVKKVAPESIKGHVALHGTDALFSQFDPAERGGVSEASDAREAFWLTDSESRARKAAQDARDVSENTVSYVRGVRLNPKNPIEIDQIPVDPAENARLLRRLKRAGHDLVVYRRGEEGEPDYALLDPAAAEILPGDDYPYDTRRKKPIVVRGNRKDKPAFAVAGDPETPRAVPMPPEEVNRAKDAKEAWRRQNGYPAGFEQDNPAVRGDEHGREWLANERRKAEEAQAMATRHGMTAGSNAKALGVGSITAWVRNLDLPVEEVAKLTGTMNEERVPGEVQYDALMERVRKQGFQQEDSPILIMVNHAGEAYIHEGNTRTAVAKAIGAPTIRAEIRWYNGGEMVDGPFSPQNVKRMTEPQPAFAVAQAEEVPDPAPTPTHETLEAAGFDVVRDSTQAPTEWVLYQKGDGQNIPRWGPRSGDAVRAAYQTEAAAWARAEEIWQDAQPRFAPNGKPSKLSYAQWQQVRTPEFKAWFGDWEKYALMPGGVWNDDKGEVSKVVDPETGEPMVVYHGTTRGGFRVFDKNNAIGHITSAPAGTSFFTNDRRMAATYSNSQTEIDLGGSGELPQGFSIREVTDENDVDADVGDFVLSFLGSYWSRHESYEDAQNEAWANGGDQSQRGLYSVFLNIRRPNEHNFEGANWDGSRDHQWVVVPVGTDDESESGLIEAPDGTIYFEERDEAERLSARTPGTTVANAGYYFMHDSTNQVVGWDKAVPSIDGSIIRNVIDEGQFFGGSGANDVFVAFYPTQIKSATQNRGTFDPKNPDITFATNDEEVRAKAFYSALTLAGENAKMTKGSAAQWYGALKNTPGVKQEELDWSGVKEWLGDRKSVTKEEVVAYLRANQLLITEQELVAPKISIEQSSKYYSALGPELRGLLERQELSTPYQIRLALSNDGDSYRALTKKFPELTKNEDWEEVVSEDLIRIDGQRLSETTEAAYLEKGEKASKYAQYQLPGGQNYRMLLLQLPDPSPRTAVRDARVVEQAPSGTYYVYDAAGAVIGQGDTPEAAREHARKMDPNAIIADTFRSSHFPDDRNVVAHIRLNERYDTDGNLFLFAETIQSDWHQQGRQFGYRGEMPAEGLPTGYKVKELNQGPNKLDHPIYGVIKPSGVALEGALFFHNKEDAIAAARLHASKDVVPDAPFKTTWPELIMKRLIRYAAENGYDGIGWTTGAQQAERWGSGTEEGMSGFYDEILPHAASKIGKKYGAKTRIASVARDDAGETNTTGGVEFGGRGEGYWFNAHGMLLTPELKTAALGGFPMFAANRSGTGMSVSEVKAIVLPLEKLFGVPIKVVPTPAGLRKGDAEYALSRGLRVAGRFYDDTGEVYLVANGIDTAQQAIEFYLHETVGHKGLRALLGPAYDRVMDQIVKNFRAEVVKAQHKNGIGKFGAGFASLEKLTAGQRRLAAEESVAYAAQSLLGKTGGKDQRSIWQKLVDYVRVALMKRGLLKNMKRSDIDALIMRASAYVRREARRQTQRAYEAKVEKARDKAVTIPKPDPVNDGPLLGMPTVQTIPGIGQVKAGPFAPARRAAAEYKRRAGIRTPEVRTYAKVNEENAKRIARAYQNMKHDPLDPRVKAAYDAMVRETLAQYQAIKATGLKVEFISDGQDPYAASPRLAIEDVRSNNHLWVFPTDSGFGMDADAEYMKNNPLLQPTNEFIGRRQLLANDVFRIVHDYFGHIQEGNGFRADGEENAWRIHASMYSPLARAAMTSETRGQNSWLNFGPHGKKNRKAKSAETVYAEQKIGLLPPEFWNPEPETAALAVRSERVTPLPSRELAMRARRIFQRTIDTPESGFSLDVYGNAPPNEGYTVSTDKGTERTFTMIPTADEMAEYIDQYRDRLEAGGQFFGGWRAGPAGTNRYVLDVSQWFADHDEAREAAKAAQQEAIFDLAKMETEYLIAPTFAVAGPTDSPAFKRWWKQSTITNDDGTPRIMYHGALHSPDFSAFDRKAGRYRLHPESINAVGSWFSTERAHGNIFAGQESTSFENGRVIPVYLSIQDPLIVTKAGELIDLWKKHAGGNDRLTGGDPDRFRAWLRSQGHDGIVMDAEEIDRFGIGGHYVLALEPTQIKSAIGNSGAYDPDDGRYAFAVADEVADTIRDIAKHLTPQERTRLNRSTARKLVDLFESLPDEKERGAVALAGAAARGWYRDSAETIADIFGPDAPRFAGLLAALSPQVNVQDNLKNAVALWGAWVKAGRPVKKAEIIKLMKGSLWGAQDRKGERVGVLPSWINNTVRALSVDDALNLVLSGPKVSSFAANLRNEVNEVTLDSWMAAFDKLDAKKMFGGRLSAKGDDPGKTAGYKAVAARIRQTATYLTKMTGETWTPAEVQETIWAWTKTLTELAAKYGPMSSAEEIVKDGELTNELINATVNFATLFTLPEQQELLRNLGYGERIDRAVERAQTRRSARGQAPALSGADQKRLLTAARRIDSMREDRPRAGIMGASRLDDIPFAVNEEQEAAFSVLGGNTGNADLDAFLGKIGDRKRSLGQMWQDWTENLSARAQMAVFDDLYGIKRAGDIAGISAADVGFKNAHLAKSAAELTQAMIEYGYPVWLKDGTHMVAGVEGGQGLVDILKPLGEKVNLWAAWMVARRADRLMGEGRENLFEQNGIAAALALGQQHPEFQEVADAYAAFQKKVLDFAQEAGIIDPDSRALWENADYIPFYRIIESGQIQGPNGGGVLGRVRNQIRKLKGGTANIGDPLENIARNWYSLMDASLKAHAARTVVDALDGSGLVTRAPQVEITSAIVPLNQIEKFIKNNPLLVQHLKAAGVDPAKLPPAAFAGLQKMLAVQPPSGEDIISVWRNGKREYWHVHDALLFESLMNVNKAAWGPLMEFFRFPKRFGTAMITTTAAFGVKNFFRDMLHTFVQGSTDGQTTIIPGLDSVKGAISQFRMDEASQALLAGGGSFTHGYIRAGDTAGAAATIRRALRKADPSSAVLDTPAKVFRFYRDLLNASENAHRVAIYSKMLAKGASRLDALYEARDLLDFAKRGNNVAIRFLTESVMFLNARMQGLYRLGRGASAGRAALSIAMRGSLYMLGMLALLAFQHDDERYKALTDADKASYIHFFDVFREGDHYRLPVPFEVGTIFGTFPVAIMEALISDEPDAGRQALAMFGHAITQSLDLSPDIQVAMPILELAINKDTFTKAPILTMGDEAVLPEEQDDPRLSPTLRGLARALPEIAPEALRSPKQLNHLVRGYTGPVLDYGLFATDAIVRRAMGEPAPATKTLRDYPDIKAFVQTGPQRMTRYQNDMFDIADRAERVAASIRRLENIGTDEAEARIEHLEAENFGLLNARDDFREAAQEVIDLRKTMREIQLDRNMTPEEKREELDALQNEINDIAHDVWGMRPGGPLNPDIAVELIDKDVQGRIDVLNNNKLSATARALQELE